jgi:hypothetical protein
MHEPPLLPQAAFVGGTHCPVASQQPDGHDAPLHAHAPWAQVWPAAHAMQVAPAVPHAETVGVVTQ